MSKLTKTLLSRADSRIGSMRRMSSRIDPSVSIGSHLAESDEILIETLTRGTGPRWSDSSRGSAFHDATEAGRLLMRSRYFCW
jgi:hypothetical protein